MSSKNILWISTLLILLLMSSFAFAEVNAGTWTMVDGAGVDVNYHYGINLSDQLFDHYSSWTSVAGTIAPVVCDIDKDGKQEILSVTGSSIEVRGLDETKQIELESSIVISQFANESAQINSIACVPLKGDAEGDDILIVHKGQNDKSITDNVVLFIEYQPEDADDLTQTITYDEYQLVGYYPNVRGIIRGQITCSSSDPSQGDEYSCLFGEDGTLNYIDAKPLGDTAGFNCDASGFDTCKVFDFTTQLGVNYEPDSFTEGTGNEQKFAQQSYVLTFTNAGEGYAHLYTEGNDVIVLTTLNNNNAWSNPRNWTISGSAVNSKGVLMLKDANSDGVLEPCLFGSLGASGNLDGKLTCNVVDGSSETFNKQFDSPSNPTNTYGSVQALSFHDRLATGTKEFFAYGAVGPTANDVFFNNTNEYDAYFGASTQRCSPQASHGGDCTMSLFVSRYELEDNKMVFIAGDKIGLANVHGFGTTLDTLPHGRTAQLRPIDLDGDFELELLAYETNTGMIYAYINQPILPSTEPTIQLVNETKIGDGYFGWYSGNNCNSINTTFEALECVGGATSGCTYNSTQTLSQERICTTCGGTQSLTCGEYSFANPTIECDFSDGTYDVELMIESTSAPSLYQAQNDPAIEIVVSGTENGTTCNIVTNLYDSPEDTPLDPTEDTSPSTPSSSDPIDTPDEVIDSILGEGNTATKFVVGIAMIIGIIAIVGAKTSNGFVLILTGVLATLLVTMLGLVPVFILIIMFAVGLLLLLISKLGHSQQ